MYHTMTHIAIASASTCGGRRGLTDASIDVALGAPRDCLTGKSDPGAWDRASPCARPSGKLAPLRLKTNFFNRIKLIWAVQSSLQKYFCFSEPKSNLYRFPSHPKEGRIMIVAYAG
jgi:hypothetical protein